jgi:MATE family, multidrug efflux pump
MTTPSCWSHVTPANPPDITSTPAPAAAGALTVGPLRPVVLRLAAPAVAMMACHFSFNLIDSIWVGRLIGPAALAAVSTAGFYVWVALSLGEMVEIGLIAVAARRHGEGDPARAARAAAAAVAYALLAGLVVSIIGLLIADAMFRLMSVPPEVARLGRAYLSTWLLGCPLVFGFFAIEATFRAAGDTRTPFMMLAGSVGVSIVLDPLLIIGIGPFPHLGVEGAALASVMVRGGGFLLGLVLARRRGLLRIGAPDWRSLPTIVRIGAPLSLSGVLLSVIYMLLTRFTSQFGTPALAALGIGHKMEGLGFIAITGFALAAGALVGQNLGARQEGRAREAVRLTLGYCLVVTVTTAVAFLLIPEMLVALFTRDPQVIADGVLYLRVIAFAQIGQSFELILEGALAGAGYTFWPQIASTTLTALRIPLAAWWSRPFGLLGIWLALSVTAIARGIAMILFWKGGKWRAVKV